MKKNLILFLSAASVIALSSCSSKLGELSADNFNVTPNPLESRGGQVAVTINGTFPEKYMKKKAMVTVIPELRYGNGQAAQGQAAKFQGEKVEGNDQTIAYKAGGNYTMKSNFKYVPEMQKSDLYMTFDAYVGKKKKKVEIPAVKVAEGVIATSELYKNTLAGSGACIAPDTFQRVRDQRQAAQIKFLINQANLRKSELKNNSVKEFVELLKKINADKEGLNIKNVEVLAYASPDGGFDFNDKLASKRQDVSVDYAKKQLKSAKVQSDVTGKYTAQDWEGFQELVSKSNIQDKELILRVLSMYQDPEQREQEIKNISSVYKTLADEILPQLRRSRLTLNYEIIGKSDEEIANLADSDAKQLNIEELLYATTLTKDAAKQEAIFTKATQIYPNDFRAYNNLGKLAYQAGDLNKAESYFKKALSIKDAPEANMNLGLIALTKGDRTAAESYLSKASGSKELNEALGNLYVAQGQYDKAVSSFGDTKTNSAALAQILAKDYNKAKNTLAAIERPDAYTDYLMAVLGARTNNTSMVTSSLKNAIAKEPALAKKAASDLEFAKYFTNTDFMNIIK